MGVEAVVLFPFAVQTVYSMHLVHTHLHCCTTRLCNEADWNYSNVMELSFGGEEEGGWWILGGWGELWVLQLMIVGRVFGGCVGAGVL